MKQDNEEKWMSKATQNRKFNKYCESIICYKNALKYTYNETKKLNIYRLIGETYEEERELIKAKKYHNICLERAKYINNIKYQKKSYTNLGLIRIKEYDKKHIKTEEVDKLWTRALNALNKALNLARRQDKENKGEIRLKRLGKAYLNVAEALYSKAEALGESDLFVEAQKAYREGAKNAHLGKSDVVEGKCRTGLGNTYIELKNYNVAREQFNLDILICEREKDYQGLIKTHINLARLFLNQRYLKQSIEHIRKAKNICTTRKKEFEDDEDLLVSRVQPMMEEIERIEKIYRNIEIKRKEYEKMRIQCGGSVLKEMSLLWELASDLCGMEEYTKAENYAKLYINTILKQKATEANYIKEFRADNLLYDIYYHKKEYAQADIYIQEALRMTKEPKYPNVFEEHKEEICQLYLDWANLLDELKAPIKDIKNAAMKSIKLARENNFQSTLITAYSNMEIYYEKQKMEKERLYFGGLARDLKLKENKQTPVEDSDVEDLEVSFEEEPTHRKLMKNKLDGSMTEIQNRNSDIPFNTHYILPEEANIYDSEVNLPLNSEIPNPNRISEEWKIEEMDHISSEEFNPNTPVDNTYINIKSGQRIHKIKISKFCTSVHHLIQDLQYKMRSGSQIFTYIKKPKAINVLPIALWDEAILNIEIFDINSLSPLKSEDSIVDYINIPCELECKIHGYILPTISKIYINIYNKLHGTNPNPTPNEHIMRELCKLDPKNPRIFLGGGIGGGNSDDMYLALFHTILQIPNLHSLDLSENQIKDEDIRNLIKLILIYKRELNKIRISNSPYYYTPLCSLIYLNLSNNQIYGDAIYDLWVLITEFCPLLQEVHLDYINIGSAQWYEDFLVSIQYFHSLKYITFVNSDLKSFTFKGKNYLQKINLSYNQYLILDIANLLFYSPVLNTLDLSMIQGDFQLIPSMLDNLTTYPNILSLNLCFSRYSQLFLPLIALNLFPNLKYLDLSENIFNEMHIGDLFANLIIHNLNTLTELKLNSLSCLEESIFLQSQLLEIIEPSEKLECIQIKSNNLPVEYVQKIVNSMREKGITQSIHLIGNNLPEFPAPFSNLKIII